jgi:hypothetical protein
MIKKHLLTGAVTCAAAITLPSALFADEKPVSLLTAFSSTTLSGYVDTSAQWNFGTGNANLPPYAFGGTSKADGFNLNVVDIQIEKPVDTAELWSSGYKVELLAGPDANTFATQSSGNASDFAIKQAYVALHAPIGNGLDLKLGVWDTIIGYESFNSPSDPNFTRSYGYTMEPTTHTGVLGTYNVCDALSISAGVANTFGPVINERAPSESYKTYMGGFTFTAPTNSGFLSGSTISAAVLSGFNSLTLGNETSYYVGGTVNTPVTGLKAGFAFDYMDVHSVSGETYAIGAYVSFQATEKLSLNGRAEYVRDRGDQKLFLGAPDRFGELTATAQYDLWKNVITRLELRWDRSFTGGGVWGDSENQKNEVMLAANVIYKF